MQILIQDLRTGLYLNPNKEWVGQESEALSFGSCLQVIDFCVREQVENAKVLIKFGYDPKLDICLPVERI